MAKNRSQELVCTVVNEKIVATLKQKLTISFGAEPEYIVKCDQDDCQYVDENKPPCPLTLDMFRDELEKIKERRAERKAESY